MKNHNIAVTGVGGGVGLSVIKSLYNTRYNVIGLDGEPLGTGLYLTPKSYKIPYANNHDYIPQLLDICKNNDCKLLFPGLDAELMPLALNKHKFDEIGTTVVVSRPEVITISDDKLETYKELISLGVNVPKTFDLKDWEYVKNEIEFPIIVKQRLGGARSKNVYMFSLEKDLVEFLENIGANAEKFIVQEYIEGDEYTCGSVNLNDVCKGVIVMRRILRDGDTYKCFSELNPIIESEVRKVVDAIKPFGACNVQLRLKNGIPYVFEINARCSGTTAARTLCGFNEPKMIADYLLEGIEPSYRIEEKTILRYWTELEIDNKHVQDMKNNAMLTNCI
ncbi:carbamoyl-phosphate synthase large subunit [Dysgonomonas sp. PH5-45]|uniref:ATP-grasp domain-containing protein n=1 Tax=unclassified Dysgonomonas TaxID=2630389 RepID=UPI002475CB2C|nr:MULTISPECIES: ATP-grasp domain-containing protein [unclassified Dysgonomonas]MDH6355291.1 carbamoyl-phosphate synthase large subunit [Dysgonomonas sp. PH5-45]MDH6388183.1 carbamoyl-phosphate synthase large subunit [Dysgonomonas sp. PH5-37]